jgi:putative glutamine amidotransferase
MTIGITYTGTDDKHQYYANWVKSGGANIEIITLHYLENNIGDLNKCDGIVFSGGVDVHPDFYSATIEYANAPAKFNKRRDEFEISIFNLCKQQQLPMLGICRGLQLFNVAQGGNLIQDLGTLNQYHTTEDSTVADKQHEVVVLTDSLLHSLTYTSAEKVTSAHHQAIDTLGENLVANAFSTDDNIIEGIEWENKNNLPFMLAVQWHPERMFRIGEGNNALCKNIREAFLKACVKR